MLCFVGPSYWLELLQGAPTAMPWSQVLPGHVIVVCNTVRSRPQSHLFRAQALSWRYAHVSPWEDILDTMAFFLRTRGLVVTRWNVLLLHC